MSEATGEGGERRLGVALAEFGTRLIAKRLENHDWQTWVRLPLSPPLLRHSFPLYPIVRIYREIIEELRDVAPILREGCRFFAVG